MGRCFYFFFILLKLSSNSTSREFHWWRWHTFEVGTRWHFNVVVHGAANLDEYTNQVETKQKESVVFQPPKERFEGKEINKTARSIICLFAQAANPMLGLLRSGPWRQRSLWNRFTAKFFCWGSIKKSPRSSDWWEVLSHVIQKWAVGKFKARLW